MKIISFPHYTCGGLLCDILNDEFSTVGENGGLESKSHYLGKIGDNDGIFKNFSEEKLFERLLSIKNEKKWIGTHCWLGEIDLDNDLITQVINITTETFQSKAYRWSRAYHLYFIKSNPWQNLSTFEKIDKGRETAKNYLMPFEKITHNKVCNLEFSDIVNFNIKFVRLIENHNANFIKHYERWKNINHFLYDQNFWTSTPINRLHEAEYEVNLGFDYEFQ